MYKATALAIVGLLTCGASGAVITFDLGIEISGSTPPAGDPPWLNATFDDGGSAGSVTLTLTPTNTFSEGEFVSDWLFNLDPDLEPTDLVFTLSLPKTGSFDDPTVSKNKDTYKADGDGYFDIEIAFVTKDGAANRFGKDDIAVYTITGIDSLVANSFDFISMPDGEQGEYTTAAHVQGIGEDSGWVAVPEPATLLLLAIGGLAVLIRRRRRVS